MPSWTSAAAVVSTSRVDMSPVQTAVISKKFPSSCKINEKERGLPDCVQIVVVVLCNLSGHGFAENDIELPNALDDQNSLLNALCSNTSVSAGGLQPTLHRAYDVRSAGGSASFSIRIDKRSYHFESFLAPAQIGFVFNKNQ